MAMVILGGVCRPLQFVRTEENPWMRCEMSSKNESCQVAFDTELWTPVRLIAISCVKSSQYSDVVTFDSGECVSMNECKESGPNEASVWRL